MHRPSPVIPAILLLTGLILASASSAQAIPGLPFVPDDPRPEKKAAPEPQKPKGQLLDRIVAIAGEGVVTQSELDSRMAEVANQARQEGRRLPSGEEVKRRVLDDLINRELQLQRAERNKIAATDEEVSRAIAGIADDNKIPLVQLPEVLKSQGIDYPTWREEMRKQIILAKLEDREVLQHINVTPRELEQATERLKKLPNENDEFDVSDILIALPEKVTRADLEAAEKKAQDIYERAAKEDFAQLATAHSDATSGLGGGKLGWRKGPDLPPDLAETIIGLKPGEVSKPVLVQANGFHILKLNGVRHAEGDAIQDQVHVRHILLRTDALQDGPTLSLKLAGVRQLILGGEDFAVFASRLSQDSRSAVEGGMLEWLPTDAFDPVFAKVVEGLKDNEISPPFESSHGWHIVQLMGRRKFDITEDTQRERAFMQLRKGKAEQERELWRRQLRNESFVEIIDTET